MLLLGPTGTGKELFARALHERSRRHARPLVRVNCAALPPSLVESELFGHEKGAFTGAVALRQGRFELADGGTIFLDEIGDMPMDLQANLLRFLQEKQIDRVGGKDPVIVTGSADLELATDVVLRASVLATGQACQSLERVYVQDTVYDEFVSRLVEKASAVRGCVQSPTTYTCGPSPRA